MSNYVENLMVATRAPATGAGPIQRRLFDACYSGFCRIDRSSLPSDLKPAFDQIHTRVTSVSGPEGALKASILSMAPNEATDVSHQILNLTLEALRLHWRGERKNLEDETLSLFQQKPNE